MINFDDVTKENIKEHHPNWPEIPDHPYRILIIGDSGSGKTSSLFNLISDQEDIDKIPLQAKNPYEAKYKFFMVPTKKLVQILEFSRTFFHFFQNFLHQSSRAFSGLPKKSQDFIGCLWACTNSNNKISFL